MARDTPPEARRARDGESGVASMSAIGTGERDLKLPEQAADRAREAIAGIELPSAPDRSGREVGGEPPETRRARRSTATSRRDITREPAHATEAQSDDPTAGTPPRSVGAVEPQRGRPRVTDSVDEETREELSIVSSVVGILTGLGGLI